MIINKQQKSAVISIYIRRRKRQKSVVITIYIRNRLRQKSAVISISIQQANDSEVRSNFNIYPQADEAAAKKSPKSVPE